VTQAWYSRRGPELEAHGAVVSQQRGAARRGGHDRPARVGGAEGDEDFAAAVEHLHGGAPARQCRPRDLGQLGRAVLRVAGSDALGGDAHIALHALLEVGPEAQDQERAERHEDDGEQRRVPGG
jgi:hypothetical protein